MKKLALILATGVLCVAMTACGQDDSSASSEENSQDKYYVGNIDNFSVNSNMAAVFARDIKAAVADKDLEALADLAAFPLYMGFSEGGVSVDSREDFIALGEDTVCLYTGIGGCNSCCR